MTNIWEVKEGVQQQLSTESKCYTVDTTNVGDSPANSSVTVYDESVDENVTNTVMSTNSPSESDNVITLSPLESLTEGHAYRVEVSFEIGTSTWTRILRVHCPEL